MTLRAALYARVSTSRQAEHDISIPHQLERMRAYCEAKGWSIVAEFEERGASATTDNRPEFKHLITQALSGAKPFDVIVVLNESRFMRNAVEATLQEDRLARKGVKLARVTEEFAEDASGELFKGIVRQWNQHESRINAERVTGAMAANAREGFWNGSKPPFGYRTFVAETRGTKEKKKLKLEPREAEIVRLAFELYASGDGRSGPMGIKKVVRALNDRGLRNRSGNPFSVQFIGKLLRTETYIGQHYFNRRNSRTGDIRPREEWIPIAFPSSLTKISSSPSRIASTGMIPSRPRQGSLRARSCSQGLPSAKPVVHG